MNGALLNRTVGMYKPFSLERPPHGGERGHPDMQRDGPVSGQRHADWGAPAPAPTRIGADPAAGDRRHRVEPRVVLQWDAERGVDVACENHFWG